MKPAIIAILIAGCATITTPFEARCNEDIHEILHTDGVWRARIDCRGERLTCYWSDLKQKYRPLRWASDPCHQNNSSKPTTATEIQNETSTSNDSAVLPGL
jgi:hypothetical protein